MGLPEELAKGAFEEAERLASQSDVHDSERNTVFGEQFLRLIRQPLPSTALIDLDDSSEHRSSATIPDHPSMNVSRPAYTLPDHYN
ncbi:MAG: hypothetical protein OJI67_05530, partial [Prosthecobacter sp.]|nr:hypothetical protein [Prosthecobacter sp.]